MAETKTSLNEKIKKKLLALSESVRRNLLLSTSNVQRKFVLEERDFLSILILAIQHLNKQPQQSISTTTTNNTEQKEHDEESNETIHTKQSPHEQDNMGKGGGGKTEDDDSNDVDDSERLRKELLRIVNSSSFDSDAKSYLILDSYNRYQKQKNLAKERKILNAHLKTHPNVMVGGGTRNDDDALEVLEKESPKPRNKISDAEQLPSSTATRTNPSSSPSTAASATTPNNNSSSPVETWISDAIKVISSCMQKKINILFLDNMRSHGNKLQTFLMTEGSFDKDNNRAHAPHNRFYLKKNSLHFKIKSTKNLQKFDLATLLACISFSRSKLFRFLQYRFKKVKPFSKNEKQCLHIFLTTCPISKKRIPCKSIRDLAKL